MSSKHSYIVIDLKSFYASVECLKRGLDPLDTNLVVADSQRTDKTICLAVTPSLKSFGIPGRTRLFEVVQKVKEINYKRKYNAPDRILKGTSCIYSELISNPSLSLNYIIAPPNMAHYMKVSSQIYNIYLNYIAPEDMHVYSIDEVFIDATAYLKTYRISARELAKKIISDILKKTGITATAGIGTNLYLAKIALDIVAKKIDADENGVRIAELDEISYREKLWNHRPLNDFWRIGRGYTKRLEEKGIFTMGDIARCSIGNKYDMYNEDLLYKMFGINAELLIDHAWGWEPCTIKDIKSYKPENNSISSGQVLQSPYSFEMGRLIVREMTDLLVLDLVEKKLLTNQMVLTIGYDVENLKQNNSESRYKGKIVIDTYGRRIPKSSHGTINLKEYTSSTRTIIEAVTELYEKITDPDLTIRRVYVVANHVIPECNFDNNYLQLDFFTDYEKIEENNQQESLAVKHEKAIQQTVIEIKKRFGKNAVVKGMNLEYGATTMLRNAQVGGHKA